MSYRTARDKKARNALRVNLRDHTGVINSWQVDVALGDARDPSRRAERLRDAEALRVLVTESRFEAQDAIYRRYNDPLAYTPQRLTSEAQREIISATDDVIRRLTPPDPGRRK